MKTNKHNLLAVLLTLAALFVGQTAWAQHVLTLSEDNDFPAGTVGHYYVNMLTYSSQQLTLTEADLTQCGYTFKVYDNGGKDGNYAIGLTAQLTITIPDNYSFLVTGVIRTKHAPNNLYLRFNDGNNTTIGNDWYSDIDGEPKTVGPVTCDGNVLRIFFRSGSKYDPPYAGFDLTITATNQNNLNSEFAVSKSNPTHGTLVVDKQTAHFGETVTVTPTPDNEFFTAEVSYTAVTTKYVITRVNGVYSFTMPPCDVSVGAVFMDGVSLFWGGEEADGSAEHPYIISNQAGYDLLVTKSKTHSYAGKHFELDTDISGVIETIGSDINYPFCGHIDGKGHKVTLALESAANLKSPAMITFAGEGCSVENLNVNGTITMTDGMYGAGFISQAKGAVVLTNCRSNVTITYTANYPTPHNGGFIGKLENEASAMLSRCLFDGTFISETAQTFGGMVGGGGNITIQNSVVVTSSNTSLTSSSNNDNYAFSFPSSSTNLSNNYYVYDASPSQLNGTINRYNGNGQTQAWLLTLTEPATIVRTGGTAIGNGAGTIYADGFTHGSEEYYIQDAPITLNAPAGIRIASATYNGIAATPNPDGTASFPMLAANTVAITSLAANYIDANGTLQTHDVSLLNSSHVTVTKAGGWYAVTGDVTLSKGLIFSDDAHLILTDGATLNVNDAHSDDPYIAIEATSLSVYGQTLGTGILNAYSRKTQSGSSTLGALGHAYGIQATGNVTFCGGYVNATATGLKLNDHAQGFVECHGIKADGNVTVIRGHVSAIASKTYGDDASTIFLNHISANVILDWRLPTDRICLTTGSQGHLPPVSVAEGKTLWNGSEVLSGGISWAQFNDKMLQPCITRAIEGYGNGNDKWAFIASPVTADDGILPTTVGNIFSAEEYDLYRLNQSANKQWENYKAHTDGFVLENSKGYLYASKETKTLAFMGDAFNTGTAPVTVPLAYDGNAEFAGWNLVGNPFTENATLDRSYYVMNTEGTGIVPTAVDGATLIAPCTGVLVQATAAEQTVTFTKATTQQNASNNQGNLQITLTQANTRGNVLLDNAIVSFNEGSQLGKFYFGEQNGNIYIPQGGEEYAIVSVGGRDAMHCVSTEIPVNFKAKKNGEYMLCVETANSQLSTVNYLHLIDNLTGANIDLLQTPSYTFTAKTTDYASRFKLVFNAQQGGAEADDNFAFISNGEIIISGEGTLQVIDALGRILFTKEITTANCQLPTSNYKPGVYVLRLVNGQNVKTQKIVIR